MCGIIGATSSCSDVVPLLIRGLQRLEYRGYDSVGVAVVSGGLVTVRKGAGELEVVRRRLAIDGMSGTTGIGHTRWATHGPPNDVNAHPHTDCTGTVAIVHNGVIRNYASLREELIAKGHRIRSETDTELVAHLIEEGLGEGRDFVEALARALMRVEGTYAFAILNSREPDRVYFAKNRSPLLVGVGDKVKVVASDLPAMLEAAKDVIFLEDGEFGYVTPTEVAIYRLTKDGYAKLSDAEVASRVRRVNLTPEAASKGGYPHFMVKEIYEQPQAVRDTYEGNIDDPALAKVSSALAGASKVIVVAAGTSYHAGLVFSYLLARRAGLLPHAIISSEAPYLMNAVEEGDLVVAVSQSGETYDTLEAVRMAKDLGAIVVGVTNVLGSALDRISDLKLYTRAGPEIGVAATKTFLSQVMLLELLSIRAGVDSGRLKPSEAKELLDALREVPQLLTYTLEASDPVATALSKSVAGGSMYVLGRGLGSAIAREGALKVKEIAYLHAEAYPAGESKHGPIALVERGFPVFIAATSDAREVAGNAVEMAARGARVYVVKPADLSLDLEAKETITRIDMPPSSGTLELEPFILTPVFQLFAYRFAVGKGYNPDKPRNLAKTVTVE
ncbi:glutamine--fructose-6-phosphate transaminase (isomerizing) [Acidilobus sp. 7A]|uniref:glutamine--fructose-6-phosphate transaminase (isomerizing) n=1 Tax=Acidilobus sp. 7A TaxID=1577685 RepID=UPI000764F1AA|nr:glutamine--fructose-6-phosphate transaminase (isomerizing) [Acidilobus sp. 7A]AMD30268.1 glucosamine--fructose-6-phosphate aminotransferase [Acidilobus sp. 7A]